MNLIRTAVLHKIMEHGMSVREYHEKRNEIGLNHHLEKDIAMVDFKLRMYKLKNVAS